MLLPITRSLVFGGRANNGCTAADAGWDAIISFPEQRAGIIAITRVVATYGLSGNLDYGPGGANEVRSFMGRLSIVNGVVNRQLSLGGPPNPQLNQLYPADIGEVLFDVIINDFTRPWTFEFNGFSGPGAIIGKTLSVILLAGGGYTAGGVPTAPSVQMLDVQAIHSNDPGMVIGDYKVV